MMIIVMMMIITCCFRLIFVFTQITCPGKSSVRQAVQPVALELHICDFRLRMSDTLAVVSPSAEASLLDGDIVLLEDTTRVRDERGGILSVLFLIRFCRSKHVTASRRNEELFK